MTMRTPFRLVCDCGHEGSILLVENDAPYSRAYEKYQLRGFSGSGHVAEPSATWDEAFEAMKPKCPECGRLQTPGNLAE